jgi:iron complex transport system ATP-binding protein
VNFNDEPVVQLSAVSWVRSGKIILDHIDWTVGKNENWVIFGLNGAGKTSLLNIIAGYMQPSSGQVSVLGRQFGRYDLRELRKSIGWVSAALKEMFYATETAEEMVIGARDAVIRLLREPDRAETERAQMLLEQVGCAHLAGRQFTTFSDGERQRVLIARALFNQPALLVLDEPVSSLDYLAREELLLILDRLAGDLMAPAMIFVTHRFEDIPRQIFTKIMLLDQGRVHSCGSLDELLSAENLSDFLGCQVQVKIWNKRYYVQLAETDKEG